MLKNLLSANKSGSEGGGAPTLADFMAAGKLGLMGLNGIPSSALGQVDPDLAARISVLGSGADLSQAEQALMFPSSSPLYAHGDVPSSFETDAGWFDKLPLLSWLSSW